MNLLSQEARRPLAALLLFAAMVLGFTVLALSVAPSSVDVGGARPIYAIPGHALELAGFGVALGIAAIGVFGRGGLGLALLLPAMVVLLDLDHIPAFVGVAQPIRPAHSIVFLISFALTAAIVLRRIDLSLIGMSATLGHLGVDSGLFPPFAPLSFDYFQLEPFRVVFIGGSVAAAIAAGVLGRRRRMTRGGVSIEAS